MKYVGTYMIHFSGFEMMSDGPLMGPGGGSPPPNMGPNRARGPPPGHGDWVNDMENLEIFSGEDQNFNPHPGNNFFGSPM